MAIQTGPQKIFKDGSSAPTMGTILESGRGAPQAPRAKSSRYNNDMLTGESIFGSPTWNQINPAPSGSSSSSSDDLWIMFEEMLAAMEGDPEEEEAAAAASQAEYEARMAEQARVTALTERDSLYSSYMDAAGSAADYVNSEVTREQANANLLGIEYGITDEQKGQRVSDYFATLWGEGEQTRLEALMSEWGNPEGFEGFQVTRGDGSTYAAKEGTEVSAGRSAGMKPKVLTQDDEESLGAQTNLLGA